MIILTANAWDCLGLEVNQATWLTAKAISGHEFVERKSNILTTDEYFQFSLIGGRSRSEPSAVCEVGVLLGLPSVMPAASTTFLIRPG